MRYVMMIGALMVASAASGAELAQSDRQAILRLAEAMDRAWTAGDVNANAKLFTPNATARFGHEPLGQGREAIRLQFQAFFKDRPAGLRHVTRIEHIEQIGPDLAQWDAEVRVERRGLSGNWETVSRIHNVTLAVRQQDGWRVRSVRAHPATGAERSSAE